MTPPKILPIRLHEPLTLPEPFTQNEFFLDKIRVDRFEPKFTFDLSPSSFPAFRIPGVFTPRFPVIAAPTVTPTEWKASDTGQLMVDIFMSIDSMDFDLKRMVVNGNETGCRFSEIVKAADYPNKETCKNFFDSGTLANLHLSVRPLEGKQVSELYDFWVLYDKFPGRTGNRINGFFMTHPLNKNDQGPLKVEQEDPFESGKDFRAALNPAYNVAMGTAVPHSDKSSRIVMRPIGFLWDEAPGVSFDISENMLKGWGIIDKKQYTDIGVEPFQMPRRMDKLLRFLPFPDAHDPDYIMADGCYDKKPGAIVVRPNFLEKKPSLFDVLHPEEMIVDILLRQTSISLNGRGHIDLGQKGLNRIKIKGDAKKTIVDIELGDLPSFRFNQGAYLLSAKGLKAGKIRLTLPPLSELTKLLFPITPAEDPQIVKDRCNDPTSHPKPKRDWKPLLDKLFANVEITGIKAEELNFDHKERGIKTQLRGAEIKSARIDGLGAISFTGLGVTGISLEDAKTNTKFSLGKSGITSITLNEGEAGPKITVKGIEGKDLSLKQNDGGIGIDDGKIGSVTVDMSQVGSVRVDLEKAESKGEIRYKNNGGQYEFKTSGQSTIEKFGLDFRKDDAGTHIDSKVKFSGQVKEFTISNPDTGDLTMVDTVLGSSEFKVQVELPADGSAPTHAFSVDIDVQKANLKSGHLPIGEIGASSVKNGRVHLEKDATGISGKISGELNLLIPQINIPLIEVATKGFSIEGHLKNIGIEGSGILEIGPEKISLTKLVQGDKPGTLKISGALEGLVFRDDPTVRKKELKSMNNGSVLKTQMDIASAKIEIKDLETFEFVRADAGLGRKADLKKLKIRDFSITEIEASAKIWAKFPLFGWLMGKFPLIGKVAGKLPNETVQSELRLESFDTDNNGKGRVTEISNLLIQLFEVAGRKQMAKFRLPLLQLSPENITTGKDPIELELYFKDLDRGGDIEFKLVPEDLSQRDTWKVTPKK